VGELSGDQFDEVEVCSPDELATWLASNFDRAAGVWLLTHKKHVRDRHVSHEQVLDALVAFGWCDGRQLRIDDDRVLQQISPRRTQPWARSYKVRAERLMAEGRMHIAGLAVVERAKASGMWDAMNAVDDLVVPEDLAMALDDNPPARANFDGFPPSTRRNILRWITYAKKPETRSRRLDRVASDAAAGVRTSTNG
jgi:uncharacterized protein YdeI (YjbR/CyaY-like superfamily)